MNRTLTATIAGLVLGGALLTGCGGDDEGEADDPGTETSTSVTESTSESAPTEDTSTEATDPSEPAETGGTDDTDDTGGTDDTDVPEPTDGPETDDTEGPDDGPANPEAAEFCLAFETAFDAIEELGEDFSGEPGDQVPPAVIDALRTWGDDLADADLPSDLSPDARAGVDVQVQLLQSIPDRLTFGELDGLESDLSPQESKQANATTEYATTTCDLF
ncbi:hypothetical protein GCM10023340_45640 [Nocardioides marinquilinus]|uniref:Uncharacterized protein n=1 Tax=Nocardioides marinquilinus TaxID=1210400 RepID=A0ABP9Q5D0_9ACTN